MAQRQPTSNQSCETQEEDDFVEFQVERQKIHSTSQSITSELDLSLFEEQCQRSKMIFKIPVKDGISRCNILAITLVAVTSFILSTFFNAQLIFLLANPDYFGVPRDKIGYVTGMLSFVSTPGAILGCLFAGYLYDLFGRRVTIGLSLICSSILVALVPWTSPYIYPWLITIRIAFSMFLAVPMSNPLSADYIQKNALGRGMSLSGIGVVIGELICMGIIFKATKESDPVLSFGITGVVGCFLTVILIMMIREPPTEETKKSRPLIIATQSFSIGQSFVFTEVSEVQKQEKEGQADLHLISSDDYEEDENKAKKVTFCSKIKEVQKEFYKTCVGNKMMLVCLIGACISRLYAILFSTFWLLFISSFVGSQILNAQAAETIYSNVMIVSVVLGVALVPLAGFVADKFNPQFVIPIVFLMRFGAIAMFTQIHDPNSFLSYGTSVMLVLGTLFEGVTLETVLMRNAKPNIRGLMMSAFTAFGYFGQLFFSIAGGIIFDRYGPKYPFYFVGCLDLTYALICICLACCGTIRNDIATRKGPSF